MFGRCQYLVCVLPARALSNRAFLPNRSPAERTRLAPRNKIRRLPPHGAPRGWACATAYTRGHDWTQRFKLIADAAARLRCGSCLIDGEAVACDHHGVRDFKLLIRDVVMARPSCTPLIYSSSTERTCGANR